MASEIESGLKVRFKRNEKRSWRVRLGALRTSVASTITSIRDKAVATVVRLKRTFMIWRDPPIIVSNETVPRGHHRDCYSSHCAYQDRYDFRRQRPTDLVARVVYTFRKQSFTVFIDPPQSDALKVVHDDIKTRKNLHPGLPRTIPIPDLKFRYGDPATHTEAISAFLRGFVAWLKTKLSRKRRRAWVPRRHDDRQFMFSDPGYLD